MEDYLQEKGFIVLPEDQLAKRLLQLRARFGTNNTKIAESLKNEGIATPRGEEWKAANVYNYFKRHPEIIPQNIPAGTDEQEEPSSQETTKTSPSGFGLQDIDLGILKDLVDLYQTRRLQAAIDWVENQRIHKHETVSLGLARRPLFKGKAKNTGVVINEELLRLAREKLKTEPQRVGKSISQLVEFLIWEYVGRPMGVVVGSSVEEDD